MTRLLKQTRFRYALNAAVAAGLYILIMSLISGGVLNRYQALMLIPIGFNIILAVSLNLSAGFLGQLPLGHAGFMSVGGYASALFSMSVTLPTNIELPLALIVGGLVAAAFGIAIGLPALRLRGDYLAIMTLGFGEIIRVIILNLNFTGGAFGLKGIGRQTTVTWTYISVLVTLFVISTLIKSRHGRAILSIREDEIAAEASGIPTTYYKVLAFSVSAGFAGVAGGLYAHYLSILDPSTFGFMRSAEILVIVVLGGLGSLFGSVISAAVLTILPELLRGFAEYRMVIYSLLLVVVMIFKPSGLCGRYEFSLGDTLDGFFSMIRGKMLKKGGESGGGGS
ncbi:MAG: branched-chain amino acid ABC transporter permease [Synergistaceae bacterium]|jgi:branched-chain amino acid transport system permease protein|nr:branched-chain amino acid ABC transporter permease [Synergistaceae bacterium]